MKILKTITVGVAFIIGYTSSAQSNSVPVNEPDYNKPKLFADLPQRMSLKVVELEALFTLPVGSAVNTQATDQLRLQGSIVSKAEEASVQSVVIRSSNRLGANFTFTRTINADGSFTYIGRMLSMQHGDAYEAIKENGQYVLNKIGLYDLFNE